MSFLRQIKSETVNIFRSKFLLIIGILVLLSSIVIPVVTALSPPPSEDNYPGPVYERAAAYDVKGGYVPPAFPGGDQESITVDGVVITSDNPSYWALVNIQQQRQAIQDGGMTFENNQSPVIALDVLDMQEDFYMHFAKNVTEYNDYRMEYQWNGMSSLGEKFLYENSDKDPSALLEVCQMYGLYWDTRENFDAKYINISSEERIAAIEEADELLSKIYDMVDNNNFAVYIDLSIQQQMKYIADNEAQIAIFEQNIIDYPEQEDSLNQQIVWLQNQNKQIKESTLPLLEYRLEKNIIPNTDAWQNSAISDLQQAQGFLLNFTIVSEEDFNKPENQYMKDQYGTYYNYKSQMEAQKFQHQNMELVAQNSLDADKPDMKFVPDGSRSATVRFLYYSIIVALFAVLLGGWIMGSEFQLGTIRLLLIRPKTRTKILMAKFTAALALCLGIYLAGCILNIVTNGVCFGFSDFAFPNYNVAGGVNFFAFYIPEMLACTVSIIFGFCAAFMISMLVKNIAVSIAIPVICFVGCYLLMDSLTSARMISWIAYTPIPYVQMFAFFMPTSTMSYYIPYDRLIEPTSIIQLMQRGMPLSVAYGIILLLALSAVCVLISILTFRKKDITN
jgi:ABC-type transport system involved in multi-copper enzyme maturation permease subunit